MTTHDRLLDWTTSDQVYAAHAAGISDYVIARKFGVSASTLGRMVEQGKRRRQQRTGNIDQILLEMVLPIDVLLVRPESIHTIQEGCSLGTLIEALHARE